MTITAGDWVTLAAAAASIPVSAWAGARLGDWLTNLMGPPR